MKILIINPNSDPKMTEAITKTAVNFAGEKYEAVCLSTPGAPMFIETYEDAAQAASGMIRLLRENEEVYDGFIIACHCDPNLDMMKEITSKPVVGIGEASMKIASMLGHKFSVISDTVHSIPNKEDLARKYHLENALASVKAPMDVNISDSKIAVYAELARNAVEKDAAEVLVLGCAGLTGMDKHLEATVGAPVLDGIICALILVSGLIQYGISTSKIRKYNPHAD
ncbi:aspartate/glutamate racemase family protein [Acidobacteriota bacterium]